MRHCAAMTRDLDSALLRVFVTVAESGSVSEAAARLARTPAAVSMALRRLEEELQARLFDRSTHGMSVTDAGRSLLPYAHRALGAASELRLRAGGASLSGSVRLGLIEDCATGALPGVLQRFAAAHPRLSVEIIVDRSAALASTFDRGGVDLALGDRENFAARPVASWSRPLFWTAARGVTLNHAEPLPLVVFDAPCRWQDAAFAALDASGTPWRVACRSTSLLAILSSVEAGLGLAVLLGDTIHAHALRAVGDDEGLPPLPRAFFGLYDAAPAASSDAVRALRGFLVEELGAGPGSASSDQLAA